MQDEQEWRNAVINEFKNMAEASKATSRAIVSIYLLIVSIFLSLIAICVFK